MIVFGATMMSIKRIGVRVVGGAEAYHEHGFGRLVVCLLLKIRQAVC
jgi:hypothetical protein